VTQIIKSTNSGLVLNPAGYTNPITILTGVTIANTGDAVYAKASAWTIRNGGTIAGHGPGDGIDLLDGGSVTDGATALITGAIGIYMTGATGTVVNGGSIGGASIGVVYLHAGGTVTNAASAAITGDIGVYVTGAAGTVVNAGSITGIGNFGYGVYLHDSGSLSNATAASVVGGSGGVLVRGTAGTIVNDGFIAGPAGRVSMSGPAVRPTMVRSPEAAAAPAVQATSRAASSSLAAMAAPASGFKPAEH
jgi:hypothetical protein